MLRHRPRLKFHSIAVDHRAEVDGESDKASTADRAGDLSIPFDQRCDDELARFGAEARHALPELVTRLPTVGPVRCSPVLPFDDVP